MSGKYTYVFTVNTLLATLVDCGGSVACIHNGCNLAYVMMVKQSPEFLSNVCIWPISFKVSRSSSKQNDIAIEY